jgi:two-component system alkaline phosphatase synthesis response regulator PhoP
MYVTGVKKSILVVDDERDIVDLISYNMKKEGYDVLFAFNGEEAVSQAQHHQPDLIILDIMMPVLDGYDACKRLKADPRTSPIPVIFLTARSGEADEVIGLELGADDFVQKPISPRKLVARVKAVIRRVAEHPEQSTDQEVIRAGTIEINRSTYTVRVNRREIVLPRKEFKILSLLVSNRGKVFSREMLLNTIWGSNVYVLDRTVDVHVRRIREKLGADAHWIETVKGVGYRFKREADGS